MGFGFPGPYRLSRLPKPSKKDEIECPEGGVPEIVTLSEPPEFRVLEVFDEPVHTLGRVGVGVGVTPAMLKLLFFVLLPSLDSLSWSALSTTPKTLYDLPASNAGHVDRPLVKL